MRYLTPAENIRIEKSITFMVKNMEETGINKKPVILHSLKVGFAAYSFGLSVEAIIAGNLHDVVEDSDVTIQELGEQFGRRVSELVAKMTHNDEARMKNFHREDYFSDWDSYHIGLLGDDEAVFLKLIDTKENFVYNPLIEDIPHREAIKKRTLSFFDIAEKNYANNHTYREIIKYYDN
jgi:(p)ppGpp synthase/HD superfamily hydrolase